MSRQGAECDRTGSRTGPRCSPFCPLRPHSTAACAPRQAHVRCCPPSCSKHALGRKIDKDEQAISRREKEKEEEGRGGKRREEEKKRGEEGRGRQHLFYLHDMSCGEPVGLQLSHGLYMHRINIMCADREVSGCVTATSEAKACIDWPW